MCVLCIGVHRVPRLLDCPGQSEFKGPSRVVDTIATIFGDYARTSELSHRDDDGFKASSQARGATGVREGGASSGRRNDGAHYSSLVADPDSFDFRSSPERGSRSQRVTSTTSVSHDMSFSRRSDHRDVDSQRVTGQSYREVSGGGSTSQLSALRQSMAKVSSKAQASGRESTTATAEELHDRLRFTELQLRTAREDSATLTQQYKEALTKLAEALKVRPHTAA